MYEISKEILIRIHNLYAEKSNLTGQVFPRSAFRAKYTLYVLYKFLKCMAFQRNIQNFDLTFHLSLVIQAIQRRFGLRPQIFYTENELIRYLQTL
jgi:hypothetical protein